MRRLGGRVRLPGAFSAEAGVSINPNEFWWRVLLPVSSAIAAAVSAILVYRYTHRHSLRSNAERWLDCVRDDIAELIALHLMVARLAAKSRERRPPTFPRRRGGRITGSAGSPVADAGGDERERAKQCREWEKQREMLRVRLRLRLTKRTRSHERLIDRLGEFLSLHSEPQLGEARDEVVEAACSVVDETWSRIRKGYIR